MLKNLVELAQLRPNGQSVTALARCSLPNRFSGGLLSATTARATDKGPVPPKAIGATVRGSKGLDSSSCKLFGKAVDLTGERTYSGFIVTTANAWNLGAALGPFWDGPRPAMILSYGGYSLTLGSKKQWLS